MSMGLMKAIMGIAIGAAAGFGLDTLLHTEPMLSIGGMAVGWMSAAAGQRRRATAASGSGSDGGDVSWFSWGGGDGSDCGSGSDGGSCAGDGGGGGGGD